MDGPDALGDRMKVYERATAQRLDPAMPIIARIDGRAFSKFTRRYAKPFDLELSAAMRETCAYLVRETHAKIGYVQSDEISLVWQAEPGGSMFFDGKVLKMASVLASMAAVYFFDCLKPNGLPAFDCRVWQLPDRTEAANTILWRAMDARKNAVSSACRSMFSAKAMHGKRRSDMIAMMAENGIDFDAAYTAEDRHGAFYRRVSGMVEIGADELAKIPERHRPKNAMVTRSWVEQLPMPFFGNVTNREDVIFYAAAPASPRKDE